MGILDDDTESKELMNLYKLSFPKTFQSRGHYYIRLVGWNGTKQVLSFEGNHKGELQGIGSQAVGVGSTHPDGTTYDLIQDLPIQEVEWEKFKKVFEKYFRKENKEKKIIEKNDSWEGEDIKQIPLTNIFSFFGKATKNGYQGINPWHGSTTGANFSIDSFHNGWYCFRCRSYGTTWEAIAIDLGLMDCSQAGSYSLSEEERKRVVVEAINKYGLKPPLNFFQNVHYYEPQGWANSINIKILAQRKGFLKCYKCSKPLHFEERLGWFACECGERGGIKKLVSENLKLKSS